MGKKRTDSIHNKEKTIFEDVISSENVKKDEIKEIKKRIRFIKKMDFIMALIIIILIVIILLLRGCKGGYINNGTVNIPGDIINSTPPVTATSIELTNKVGYDNISFEIENMLPGDTISQYYCVSVTHDSKEVVRFGVVIDLTQKLSSVMMIKVEQLISDADDVVLYDGLMKNCVAVDVNVATNEKKKSEIYYRITVYTIGSEVDNEYAGKNLEVDFTWQIR